MTLAQLRYAVAVDTHRHFGEAATHCHVSQPTLSMQIQKLEDELGVRLFDRSRRPVLPTRRGTAVLEQARAVLREHDRLRVVASEAAGEVAGELRLGVIPTLAPYLLPLVTRPFAQRYPDVTVVVQELTTALLLDHLAADRLDAGLIATDEARTGMTTRPLFEEPFVAYVAPPHPLAGADVVDARALTPGDLWLLSEGHCFRDQVLHLCGRDRRGEPAAERQPIHFESGSLETLRLMIRRAGGLTLLPFLATLYASPEEQDRLRPLAEPVPHRTVRLLCTRADLKRPLVDAYTQTMAEAVAVHDAITLT